MDEKNDIKMIKTKYVGKCVENKIYLSLKRKTKNINQFYYKRVQELIKIKKKKIKNKKIKKMKK